MIRAIIFIFFSLLPYSDAAKIVGFAFSLECNGNSQQSILKEIESEQIKSLISGDDDSNLEFTEFKFKKSGLGDDRGTLAGLLKFEVKVDVDADPPIPLLLQRYEAYIRMRLNGVSPYTSVKFVNLWFNPISPNFLRFDGLPIEFCTKFSDLNVVLPETIKRRIGANVFEESFKDLYVYLDTEICWFLIKIENRAIFISGADGNHFGLTGFNKSISAVEGDLENIENPPNKFDSLVNQLFRKAGTKVLDPKIIPLPNSF